MLVSDFHHIPESKFCLQCHSQIAPINHQSGSGHVTLLTGFHSLLAILEDDKHLSPETVKNPELFHVHRSVNEIIPCVVQKPWSPSESEGMKKPPDETECNFAHSNPAILWYFRSLRYIQNMNRRSKRIKHRHQYFTYIYIYIIMTSLIHIFKN